jgi:hypothetical protein
MCSFKSSSWHGKMATKCGHSLLHVSLKRRVFDAGGTQLDNVTNLEVQIFNALRNAQILVSQHSYLINQQCQVKDFVITINKVFSFSCTQGSVILFQVKTETFGSLLVQSDIQELQNCFKFLEVS